MSKKINFEESLKRLEEITSKLESGELSLDESLKFFEEGISLSRFCEKKLTEVDQKLEILKSTEIPDEYDEDNSSKKEEPDIEKNRKKKNKEKTFSEESDLLF